MKAYKLISDFKPHNKGFNKVLGHLEAEIMNVTWNEENASVRDVYELMRMEKRIAYTTISTTMNRLAKKGLLKRKAVEGTFIFSPAMSRSVFAQQIVSEVLDELVEDFSGPVLQYVHQWLDFKDRRPI